MGLSYRIQSGVTEKLIHSHPALSTAQGGLVLLDRVILNLWRQANGSHLEEILANFQAGQAPTPVIRSALVCLVEAGLLARTVETSGTITQSLKDGSLVSVIIVSYNSRVWLETCLSSLTTQTYQPLEIIVVDNASNDGSAEWVKENYPNANIIHLDHPSSLAHALNQGISVANGNYLLLMNPDVELGPNAIGHMVAVAQENDKCAAVAAKLKFLWAPAFLNGIGNYVGAFSWGTDSALGHLDLGQFDGWDEIPSACFAAALIPTTIWRAVGPIDENFPLYYEDSEWCYRARLLGYTVRAAPQAIACHAFGGRVPTGNEVGLTPQKLRQVVYGRLRFITKILGPAYFSRFMLVYILEDGLNLTLSLLQGHWQKIKAYLGAWNEYYKSLPLLRQERMYLQSRRACTDSDLFRPQKKIPAPLIWNGLPQITWDIVRYRYLPLIISGKTRPIPEFSSQPAGQPPDLALVPAQTLFGRAMQIWLIEGFRALLHRTWRAFQWRLMQP